LFGGALGIRRTFILHAKGSKLPSDLLGLTSIRYDTSTNPSEVRTINQKLRKALETEDRRGPVEGLWWQLSLTVRSEEEPSAVSLLRISRDRDGDLSVNGRSWQEDGTLSARYWSEAAKEHRDPAGVYLRADPSDFEVLDGGSEEDRAQLISERLREWKSAANAF
jgi:hypothetical protein